MLHVKIIAVGKIRETYLRAGIQEYSKRLQAYLRLETVEVSDQPIPDRAAEPVCSEIKSREGTRILLALKEQDYVTLLDGRGEQKTSEEMASFLEEKALYGINRLCFVIGGSLGVAEKVKKRADWHWSFSRLTFPHPLMRLLLLEQLYRASKIRAHETYHK